ncbi:MFS transporter [Streptomyces avermitilis]|uniref:Transmembrane efflux protein n=3 Tax=Streptomyces TaxID=1883 RepID=Q82AV8_STRAW|nr:MULTISPECIES: MFS transporter [Streptomyces]KUN54489.1 MFS transporter [Streptomyces avermitilis]MYT01504.1 MFS transporter [Streptomyces sp. SID5469]OOV28032.1 MFS transporter [Streptomyces avermitilis]BAC73659.1 putative transmembrane efflux protein [Streptomyces avermitilis MA-4680 = NBRC 14893]BBJ54148.1 MFS transporter [Streptomyces avermitilis]
MPLALLALAVGAFGIGTTEFVIMGLLPDVADDLHISIPAAGHLVSAYAIGVVIGAPLLAAVTARLSRRKVLIGLMGLFVVGNALSAFAPDDHWLLAARFLSGLPHGAFFGVGAVVATNLVAPERKARSVSLMFLGLTVANVAGVPVATLMGQHLGWRATFLGVSAIGLAAIASLALLVPHDHTHATSGGLRGELTALRSLPVWLALGTTVAGFGALFSAYSYITPMLTDAAGYAHGSVTLLLALFGVGATAGNLVGGRLADHSLRGTLFGGLVSLVVVLSLFPLLMTTQWSAALGVTLLGAAAFVTGSPLQLMVMEKASAAPSLASSANQAAFNLANAGGAWIGGLALAAGFGATSPALAGAALAVLGLAVAGTAYAVDRRRALAVAVTTSGRLVATHVPQRTESAHR